MPRRRSAVPRLALAAAATLAVAAAPLVPVLGPTRAYASAAKAPAFTDLGVAGKTMGGPVRLLDDDSIGFQNGFYTAGGSFVTAPTVPGTTGPMDIEGMTADGTMIGSADFDSGSNSQRLVAWNPVSGTTTPYASPCSDVYDTGTVPEYYSYADAYGDGEEVVSQQVTCYPNPQPSTTNPVTIATPGSTGVVLSGVTNNVDALNNGWILEAPDNSTDDDNLPETRINRSTGAGTTLPIVGNDTQDELAPDGTVVGEDLNDTDGDVVAPDGTVTKLKVPAGRIGGGAAINAKHMIVGDTAVKDSSATTGYSDYRLTLWPTPTSQPVDLTSLLPAGWKNAIPFLINSRGDIVGGALAPDGKAHVFLTGVNLLTVTTSADDDEVASGYTDDECRDANNLCSLRAAIELANHRGGAQTISFALDDPRIALTSALPAVTVPVTIDGTTQPGTATGDYGIDISGAGLPSGSDGLVLTGGSSTVTGLSMAGFDGAAISLQGAGGDTVTGNFLGQETRYSGTGTPAVGDGIGVDDQSPQATITANHIWGIVGGDPVARAKAVAGGLGANPGKDAALRALATIGTGVFVGKAAASGVTISGNDLGAGPDNDLVKTGLFAAVLLAPSDGPLTGVSVDSNKVNGAILGLTAIPVDGGSIPGLALTNNTIGTQPSNVGSSKIGSLIGLLVAADAGQPTSGLVVRGNTLTNDIIGMVVGGAGTSGAQVTGNTLGSNKKLDDLDSANPILDRDSIGVILSDASGVTVSGNSILGALLGVIIAGKNHSGDTLSGNTIGAATAPHTKPDSSVLDNKGSNASLADYASIMGVIDSGGSGDNLAGNQIYSSVFGVIATGTTGISMTSNSVDSTLIGLFTADATKSTIGRAGAGNTVTDSLIGVLLGAGGISDTSAKADGLDKTLISDATRSQAFSTADAPTAAALATDVTGTDISADDVAIDEGTSPDDLVEGNTIGAEGQGNDIALIDSGLTSSMLIDKNTIAHNRYTGLLIGADQQKNTPTGVIIRGNSIWDNESDGHVAGATGLGIDLLGRPSGTTDLLTGPNPQHAGGEQDGAPNGYLNAPELVSASPSGSTLTVTGTLVADKHVKVVVEAFTDNGCNVTGYGEAQTSLGTFTVTTDGNGVATYSHAFHHRATSGDRYATATATELTGPGVGDTSEISACVSVQSGGAPVAPTNPTVTSAGGLNLTVTCDESAPCTGTDTLSGSAATTGNGNATAHLVGVELTKTVTLASGKVSIKAHKKLTLKLKLNAKALQALKKAGSLRVTSTLVIKVKGKKITRKAVFTIFAPPAKKAAKAHVLHAI